MRRRTFLVTGAAFGVTSLSGCSVLGEEDHAKPVDRARVIIDFKNMIEGEEIEVIRTRSDWYGAEARNYRLWYVTDGNPEPLPSEMAVIGKAYAESIPSHEYARGILVSSWPDAEQDGDRWNLYIKTDWAQEWLNDEIDEEALIERIEDTLDPTPSR